MLRRAEQLLARSTVVGVTERLGPFVRTLCTALSIGCGGAAPPVSPPTSSATAASAAAASASASASAAASASSTAAAALPAECVEPPRIAVRAYPAVRTAFLRANPAFPANDSAFAAAVLALHRPRVKGQP